jgi:hypothetical protein
VFLLFLLVGDLLETWVPHEAELDDTVCELLVQVCCHHKACFELLLDASIKVEFHDAGSISAEAPTAANNVCWEDEVVKNAFVDCCCCARALNFLEFVDVLGTLGDLALSNEQDNAAWEALLKFTSECLLDFADKHDEAEWIEDEQSLLVADWVLEFFGRVDVEAWKAVAERAVSHLELEESECNVILSGRRLCALCLAELAKVWKIRHFFCRFFSVIPFW